MRPDKALFSLSKSPRSPFRLSSGMATRSEASDLRQLPCCGGLEVPAALPRGARKVLGPLGEDSSGSEQLAWDAIMRGQDVSVEAPKARWPEAVLLPGPLP